MDRLPIPQIRPVALEETVELRRQVLRPDLSAADVLHRLPSQPDSLYFGAYIESKLAGVAGLYRAEPETGFAAQEEGSAWRLRGLAVLPERRGLGLGSGLLRAVIAEAARRGLAEGPAAYLWCIGRSNALSLYRRHGFQTRGEAFETPPSGLHFYLSRVLTLEDAGS